jgi:integrase
MSKDDLYRILTPSEFQAMKDAPLIRGYVIGTQKRNIWLDTLMFTGMRYKELLWLDNHWIAYFDSKNNAITLPASATKTDRDRTVHLTPAFSKSLAAYLREFKSLQLPTRDAMNDNLRRWWRACIQANIDFGAYSQWYPTPKTFRKSWESWLLFADYALIKVARSQGHTVAVCEHYYASLPPTLKSEAEQVRKVTEGWMT